MPIRTKWVGNKTGMMFDVIRMDVEPEVIPTSPYDATESVTKLGETKE